MAKSRLGWAAALLTAALACVDRSPARGAENPGNELLKKHGLKIAGSLAVALEEAEIKTKLTEARRLSKQLSYSLLQQKGTLSPQEVQKNAKTLNDQIGQLRSEINVVNQQMSRVPRGGGGRYGSRYGGNSFANNYAAEMYAELAAYKNQLQIEVSQDSLFLNQLKSQPPDPKAKERVDSEVRDRRDAYHQAVLDLRKLVDAAEAKYNEAAKNDEVKEALVRLGKGLREKPKLGPSHDFLANVKVLEKLEKAESSGDAEEPEAKSTRRGRNKTKRSTSSKAGSAQPAAGVTDSAS